MTRRTLMILGLVVGLGVPNTLILHKERVLARSQPVLLPLAPVDPRSLMQGDYMVLRYALSEDLEERAAEEDWPVDGSLLVALDADGVATAGRLAPRGGAPAEREIRLRYRLRGGELRLSAESFFFQEGHASHYDRARFGELRVDASGEAVLVGLRDEERRPIDPRNASPPP